jgi:hypothetical protein
MSSTDIIYYDDGARVKEHFDSPQVVLGTACVPCRG